MGVFSAAILVLALLPTRMQEGNQLNVDSPQERLLIDEALGGFPRPFGRYPHTINFGPTGRRLWVNYLEEKPGFVGRIDFIHRINIPFLFTLTVSRENETVEWDSTRHTWYPSHLVMEFRTGEIRMREWKFVTWEDVAVAVVEITNGGSEPLTIRYQTAPDTGDESLAKMTGARLGVPVRLSFQVPKADRLIPQGKTVREVAGVAVGLTSEPEVDERLSSWLSDPDPVKRQQKEYQQWFDTVPTFVCDDPFINRVWAYRWYLLRRNLSHPAAGNLPHPFYLEGRGHKMSNEPWNPRGWEFSKLIPFSTPFHLLEGRWHPDVSPCEGELDDLIHNQSDDGLFQWATINGKSSYYSNFVPWAARQLKLVHPEVEITSERLEALTRNVRAWFGMFDPDGDGLPHITDHNRTGKEYQPSFFYFGDFPSDARRAQKAVLERVDVASYQYMNARALSWLCERAGDAEGGGEFSQLADHIAASVVGKMWDPGTRFFYDIRESDNEKALVKNVVGFDPFMAGIASVEHLDAFEHLWNPGEFWTPWPVPSVSVDCPAFAPDASWFGEHIKGPHGAVWNGPTWPFTNSTTLMALANAERMAGPEWDSRFADLFRLYTRLHLQHGGGQIPNLVEHYNPLTGAAISEEEDYFHSSWIDLVVTCLVGLIPSEDNVLRLDPIDCGLEFFSVRNLSYRGHRIDVTWASPPASERQTGIQPGLRAHVDGSLVIQEDSLTSAEAPLGG